MARDETLIVNFLVELFSRDNEPAYLAKAVPTMHGKLCRECGNSTVIKKDGCEFCTACGAIGACG